MTRRAAAASHATRDRAMHPAALGCGVARGHLCAMATMERVRAGVMAGVMAAATTTGAVLALAWRAGSPLRPFVESGRAVVGGAPPGTAATLGIGLHVAVAIAWGLLLAALAYRRPAVLQALGGVLVAAVALLAHSLLLPAFRLGFGLGVFPLHGAPLAFLYALFALGLIWGMRLAR